MSERLRSGALRRAFAWANAAVWAATLIGAAAIALAGAPALKLARQTLALRLTPTPPPTLWHALAIAAHNIPIAAWPLLLGPIGATRGRARRQVGDALVLGCVLANTLPVAAALAAYRLRLLPYIPQLPLEWAGLACGPAWWIGIRGGSRATRRPATWLAVTAGLLLAAAVVETYLVPSQ